jgi:hypothetical protein
LLDDIMFFEPKCRLEVMCFAEDYLFMLKGKPRGGCRGKIEGSSRISDIHSFG